MFPYTFMIFYDSRHLRTGMGSCEPSRQEGRQKITVGEEQVRAKDPVHPSWKVTGNGNFLCRSHSFWAEGEFKGRPSPWTRLNQTSHTLNLFKYGALNRPTLRGAMKLPRFWFWCHTCSQNCQMWSDPKKIENQENSQTKRTLLSLMYEVVVVVVVLLVVAAVSPSTCRPQGYQNASQGN